MSSYTSSYDLECPICEVVSIVEVINSDDAPTNCPMCGQTIDLSDADVTYEYDD